MKLAEKIEQHRARKAALAELTAYYNGRRNEILANWEQGKITYDQMVAQYDDCAYNFRAKYDVLMPGDRS